jgi:putative hydrolase of the HAD superfamily
MTPPQAACFDLDGTLFDHVGAARPAATAFLESLGTVSTEAALRSWFAAEEEQFERWRLGEVSFPEQRRQRLRTVLPPLGCAVPADDAGADVMFADYLRSYRAAWRAFPGVPGLLRELRARGYRVGLLTNGSEEQQLDKLAQTGIDELFDVVCVSERIGFQKPDASAFATLAMEVGVRLADCAFFGDDPVRDVAGARSAGMRGVLIDRATQDTATVRDLVFSTMASRE